MDAHSSLAIAKALYKPTDFSSRQNTPQLLAIVSPLSLAREHLHHGICTKVFNSTIYRRFAVSHV